jgi:hypothetical protein
VTSKVDFALDDLEPADLDSEQAAGVLWSGDLTVLAQHHASDRSRSFVVAHDESATWGLPGASQITAIAITRDVDKRTFTFEFDYHAGLPFAQAWLIERGCPPDRIALPRNVHIEPADDLTQQIEQKIRDARQRYVVLDAYTRDRPHYESWTLARDTLTARDPIRVFVEESTPGSITYTVREGAFPDEEAAREWLDNRDGPLPQPPEEPTDTAALRAQAALARSAGAPHATTCGLDRGYAPSTPPLRPPAPGRSR